MREWWAHLPVLSEVAAIVKEIEWSIIEFSTMIIKADVMTLMQMHEHLQIVWSDFKQVPSFLFLECLNEDKWPFCIVQFSGVLHMEETTWR